MGDDGGLLEGLVYADGHSRKVAEKKGGGGRSPSRFTLFDEPEGLTFVGVAVREEEKRPARGPAPVKAQRPQPQSGGERPPPPASPITAPHKHEHTAHSTLPSARSPPPGLSRTRGSSDGLRPLSPPSKSASVPDAPVGFSFQNTRMAMPVKDNLVRDPLRLCLHPSSPPLSMSLFCLY